MPSYCFYRHCPNRDTDKKISFHRFPVNPILRKKWLINSREDEKYYTRNSRICSAHFEDVCFQIVRNKRTLKNGACPTIFIPPLTKIKSTRNVTCQLTIIHKTLSSDKTRVEIGKSSVPSTSSNPTTITSYPKFEEVYIKEEPLEVTSQDCELYENELLSIKKEECLTDNDEQSDKKYENPVTENIVIRKIENVNSNSFCCGVCSKSFARESNLKEHEKIHQGIKQFGCDKCDKIFKRKTHLESHMKIHSGIKDFSCPTCNKSFSQSNNLHRHMKIHNEKEYTCTICNKQFTLYYTLKVHMKLHSNNKE